MLTAYCSALPVNSDRGKQKSAENLKITLDKSPAFLYNPIFNSNLKEKALEAK